MTPDAVRIAQRVIELVSDGSFNSTYKHAVVVALLDLCLECADRTGLPPTSLSTRQLAEKVVSLYWPQTVTWDGHILQQNKGKRATILRHIVEFRAAAQARTASSLSQERGRRLLPEAYEALVREVEWTLILMPLPKLQRLRGYDTQWLYTITWDDGDNAPRRGQVRARQRGDVRAFDNLIRLQPGVGAAFVQLHGIIRPFVQERWARLVSQINGLEEERLSSFLFGVDRSSLTAVRPGLTDLQHGACFYCARPMRDDVAIDHFVPWSRHPENAIHNLVAAHGRCNGNKSDYLAADAHVARWRRRSLDEAAALAQVANDVAWPVGEDRVLGVARAIYLALPDDARLWESARVLVLANRDQLIHTLSA